MDLKSIKLFKTNQLAILPLLFLSNIAFSAWDIEYLSSSDYETAIGGGIYNIVENEIKYYGNFQMNWGEREPQYDSLNINSFGDPVTAKYKDLLIFNFGLTKKLSSWVAGYAGVGYAKVTGIAKKYDPLHILGSGGTYYVNNPSDDESGLNTNFGLIMGNDGIVFNIGYHSFTGSTYIGIGSKF